jgi:Glyoxalase-like domain
VRELDHLIVFLRGPDDVDALRPGLAGLILDEGTRHVGQGTRNRRIVFPDSYIELLWVDSRAEAQASGLRFTQRCRSDACPLGVVLRGRAPERSGFVEYTVPAGPTLHILDDPGMPFLAVHESDDLDRLRPVHRMASECLNRACAIVHAEIACGMTPPDAFDVPQVSFVEGEPQLRLTLSGMPEPLTLRPGR